ncbi:MAG: hypothetical protein U9R15_18360 [Chloroflexota bacterium]|nr:hypothetical protein [Chloroflexota bacterium]
MTLAEKTLSSDFVVDETLAAAIRARLKEGKLPCASAFAIAREHGVTPLLVGQTADVLQIHLTRCQLGLFGYPGHAKGWTAAKIAARAIPEGLDEAIRAAVDSDGNFACVKAWEIAASFGIPKMQVAYVADHIGIRFSPCQLGAF